MALIDNTFDIEQRYLRLLDVNMQLGNSSIPAGAANLLVVQAIREAWVAGASYASSVKSPLMELKIVDIREKEDHGDSV